MGAAVLPVLHTEVNTAPQISVAATMPHCLVHATQRVQLHLLSAGVELASDLAGWFVTEEEVRAYAAHKGWLDSDLHGLVLAWAEAGRPQIAARPDVPVPWVTAPRPSAVRVPGGDGEPASLQELVPIHAQPQPDLSPLRLRLQKFFFVLGEAGDLWDPEEPMEQFQLLTRAAFRLPTQASYQRASQFAP